VALTAKCREDVVEALTLDVTFSDIAEQLADGLPVELTQAVNDRFGDLELFGRRRFRAQTARILRRTNVALAASYAAVLLIAEVRDELEHVTRLLFRERTHCQELGLLVVELRFVSASPAGLSAYVVAVAHAFGAIARDELLQRTVHGFGV